MPLEGEAKIQYDRNRRAIIKAAKQLTEEPESKLGQEDIRGVLERAAKMDEDLVLIEDARPEIQYRFKSEVRSCVWLAMLFLGIVTERKDDEDEGAPKKKKKRVLKPCSTKIFGRYLTFEEWLEYRDRSRKDLFWLGRDVLKKDLLPHVHQVICDQFVKKNFDRVYYEGYTIGDVHDGFKRQEREKVAMILDSRGNYKSTINMIDAIQWTLVAPDCRILVLTAEFKLSSKFKQIFKGYFNLAEGEKPTDLHLLFPEYVLTGKDGTSQASYYCPASTHNNQGDPSLMGNSAAATLSGWHFDVIKMDDAVSDKNSNNVEARENLKEKINLSDSLLDQWGFKDIIGTRYWGGKDPDYYEYLMSTVSESNPIKFFRRGCWVVKPEFKDVPLMQIKEHMVDLTFPEKSSFKFLRAYLEKYKERNFQNQQLNEPVDSEEDSDFAISFDGDALRAHVKNVSWEPKPSDPGVNFIAVDWAYTNHKTSDWSVLTCGRTYQLPDGQWAVWIKDIKYDKWTATELAYQIVMFNKKHNARDVAIERGFGTDILHEKIRQFAAQYGSVPINFRPPDQATGAKRNRIRALEVLLTGGRLWFTAADWNNETFRQFEGYTGAKSTKSRKDDIPDCISLLVDRFLPSSIKNEAQEAEQEKQNQAAVRKQMNSIIFGSQDVFRPPTTPVPVEEPRIIRPTPFGIPGLRSRGDA